ncbi:cupredoxin domain-containing protein [Bacillus suaedae]|uniref:Cupredoxin domain-containing protein n=1 Tax=Halalkalibacter suaedae TaxID=2822140 RepID=A0A940WQT8_9BACI|nr:cupredoxin domain-containing protein [Bacillus suaedae]MBP3950108.1 cupredoxin domain-containing protein [Bacillus suaedae]
MLKTKARVILYVVAAVLLIAGCSSSESSSSGMTVEVEGVDFAFEPSEVTIPQGEEVTLTLTNNGSIFHNLLIDNVETEEGQQDIVLEAEVNEEDSITFTATEAGTYEIYCDEVGHESMTGTLIVE